MHAMDAAASPPPPPTPSAGSAPTPSPVPADLPPDASVGAAPHPSFPGASVPAPPSVSAYPEASPSAQPALPAGSPPASMTTAASSSVSMPPPSSGAGAAPAPAPAPASAGAPPQSAAASVASADHPPPPRIYLATYSGVPVYELTVRGIACMRRRADGYLNATQILKVAGVEKTRRTKVLDKVILTGEHEKVQGGYGKYQGTWVPLRRAHELATQLNVAGLLKMLLEFDPATEGALTVAPKGKRPNPNAPSQQSVNRLPPQPPRPPPSNGSASAVMAAAAAAAAAVPQSFFSLPHQTTSYPAPPTAFAPPENGTTAPSQVPRFLSLPPPPEEPAQKRQKLDTSDSGLGPGARLGRSSSAGHGIGTRLGGAGETGELLAGLEPVRDLNTLGPNGGLLRAATLTPADTTAAEALRMGKSARMIVGPPEELANDPTTRFADQPQAFHSTGADEAQERALKDVLTLVFLSSNSEADPTSQMGTPTTQLQALLARMSAALAHASGPSASVPAVSVNIMIDDHGHAPLHWAAALGQIGLVKMLIALPPSLGGANVQAGNYAGETALHRAVLVTNGFEANVFSELLSLLHESIVTRDYKRRSILHHIAMVAALKGRATSARYYLASVLDVLFPSRPGAQTNASETNSEPLVPPAAAQELLNAQDDDGETALGIVARIGNASMTRMLLECGARKDIPNHLGIRPSDWGVDARPDGSNEPSATTAEGALPPQPMMKSEDVMQNINSALAELKALHAEEMKSKNEALAEVQAALQVSTRDLAALRRRLAEAQQAEAEIDQAKHTVSHVDRLVAFLSSTEPDPPLSPEDQEEFDALEAERTKANQSWDAFLAPLISAERGEGEGPEDELVRLRWLGAALQQQAATWASRGEAVTAQAAAHAAQCRRVVASCCNVAESRVEDILDDLVVAVESDGPSVDLGRVAGFMNVVKPFPSEPNAIPSQPTSPVGP